MPDGPVGDGVLAQVVTHFLEVDPYFDELYPEKELRTIYMAANITSKNTIPVFLYIDFPSEPDLWVNHVLQKHTGSGFLIPLIKGENLLLIKFRDLYFLCPKKKE